MKRTHTVQGGGNRRQKTEERERENEKMVREW